MGLIVSLALTVMAGPASVLAAPKPKPVPVVTATPGQVAPGNAVRFDVSFKNTTASNFSQFFLDADTPDAADLGTADAAELNGVLTGPTITPSNGASPTCGENSLGDLECTFGALNAGSTVSLAVWYQVPADFTGTFSVTFIFTTTGTPSDPHDRSHGDDFAGVGSAVVSNDNFDGGYFLNPAPIQTDPALSRRNQQNTTIPAFAAFNGGPLTAQEVNISNLLPCPQEVADDGGSCFGQWSIINVDGATEYTGGFEVIIGLDNSLTPGQINAIKFVHVLDDGSVELIKTTCDKTDGTVPGNMDCRYFTSSQGDAYAHIWLTQNGRLSGY
ncbi:MAG TPA: hypothetical protein VL687_04085 [Methylomirabilota bacterium]|nr:hypothetical protein [Methylomirabilota bacterium]